MVSASSIVVHLWSWMWQKCMRRRWSSRRPPRSHSRMFVSNDSGRKIADFDVATFAKHTAIEALIKELFKHEINEVNIRN